MDAIDEKQVSSWFDLRLSNGSKAIDGRGHRAELKHAARPVEDLSEELRAVMQSPRAGGVGDAALHHLLAAQSGPIPSLSPFSRDGAVQGPSPRTPQT